MQNKIFEKNNSFDSRELDIIEMRREGGMAFQEIGIRFGVSGERIRQIYNKIKEKESNRKSSKIGKLILF